MYQSEWFLSMKDNVYQTMSRINTSFTQGYKSMKSLQSELDTFNAKTKRVGSTVDDLNSKLNDLSKTRNLSVDTSELKKVSREIEQTQRHLHRMPSGQFGKFSDGVSMLPGGHLLGMVKNPYVIGGAAIAGAGMFGYETAQTRLNFDKSFAKVNATAQYSPAQLASLRSEIMGMGRNATGADIRSIPDAYEKILSAVNDPVLAKRILEVSLKGSQAGFADINTVSNALVGFKSIVGNVGENEIMDVLFGAKRVGKGDFNDFAQYLPRAMSMAPRGTNYKDVAGMYSFLTTKGFDAQTSGMLLENVFNQFGRSDVSTAFKGIGVPLFQGGKMRDMLSVFTELSEKMKGLNAEQQSFLLENLGFRDMQAKMGVKALIGDLDKLKEVMGEVKSGKKELDAALSFTQTGANSVQELTNKWIYFKDQLGKTTAPGLIRIVDGLNATLDRINLLSMSPGERVDYFSNKLAQEYRTNKGKSAYQIELSGTSSDLAESILKAGGSYEDYYKTVGRIRAYSGITSAQIKKNPELFGLKYYGKAGRPGDFSVQSEMMPKATGEENLSATAEPSKVLEDISGGGSVRNLTVNMPKMFDNIVIQPATLKEGLDEAVELTTNSLMRIIQGAEQVLNAD